MRAVVVDHSPLALSGSLRGVLEVHNGYYYHRCKRAYGDTNRVMWAPRLDVRELDHAFLVGADLRGMALADITVSLENGKQHGSAMTVVLRTGSCRTVPSSEC